MLPYLSHHGIAGQKWGHRNGPPYPLSPSAHSKSEEDANWRYSLNRNTNHPSALQTIARNSMERGKLSIFRKKAGNESGTRSKASSKTKSPLGERLSSPFKKAGIMSNNGIESKDIHLMKLGTLRPMSDEGIRVKKGEWVRRIISTPTQDLTGRDSLFVAATEADKKNYAGFFAALTKYRNSVDKMYKMDLQAVNDIVSPSKKERVQTFIDLYKKDPIGMSTRLAEFNKRWYDGQYKETTEQLIKKYSNMSMRQLKNEGYYIFANSWFDPDAGTLREYREELKKKGYNATIDDNDKRSFIQAQAPLIVFDVMQNFGNIRYSELTTGEMRRNMIEWQHMAHQEEAHYDIR